MKRIFFSLFFLAFIYSCNSDDDAQTSDEQETNFYALTVGNSWVYKNYRYSTQTQTYDDANVIDSVSIVGKEVLNGNEYFKFRRFTTGNTNNSIFFYPDGEHFELLRDSLGFLVRDDGSIKYINNFFDEVLMTSEDWGDVYVHLQDDTEVVNTAAGTFNSAVMLRYAYIGVDNTELAEGQERYNYSDGIGLVFNTTSTVNAPIHFGERRLDSYSIVEE